jgi:glutathione S-transferase
MNGVNETPEWKQKYNPTGQVPVLVDGDFAMWESSAIATYLNEKYQLPSNWFGATAQQRAKIQQYLHWHNLNLRRGAGAYFYTHFAISIWGDLDYSKEIAKGRHLLYAAMQTLQDYWLANSDYIAGQEVSFAELQCYHEFVSHIAGRVIPDEIWAKYPKVKEFCDRMDKLPTSQNVNAMIMKVGEMRKDGVVIPMKRETSLAKGTEIEIEHFMKVSD